MSYQKITPMKAIHVHVEPADATRYEVAVAFLGKETVIISAICPHTKSVIYPADVFDFDIWDENLVPYVEHIADKLCPDSLYAGKVFVHIAWTIINEVPENCLNNVRKYLGSFRELYD